MRKRDFLSVTDVNERELRQLFREAKRYKRNRRLGSRLLAGKMVALIFEKPSMRTRVAFEVAVMQLGGALLSLGGDDVRLGQREPIKDVARVLSRYVDAVVIRTFAHRIVEEFAAHARVPVINGLSDLLHPCQALADLLTLEEHFGRLKGLTVAYVGDGNNVLHALMQGCGLCGVNLAVATPNGYRPEASIWASTTRQAKARGATFTWSADPQRAVRGADCIYTDVWVSMGAERERTKRRRAFGRYQVNERLLEAAARGCRVMHCLPAHRGEEITDQVMEGPRSLILEQAENRLHVQKALLAFLLTKQ